MKKEISQNKVSFCEITRIDPKGDIVLNKLT